MPKFTVFVQRQTWEYNDFEVEASDETEAKTKANEIISLENTGEAYNDWFHSRWLQSDCSGDIELDEILELDEESTEEDVPITSRGFGT